MSTVITVEHVDLIYRTTESLSIKKAINILLKREPTRVLNQYKALKDVTFCLEKGNVYGLIGSNGAGKSTLLRILSGVMSPNAGYVGRYYRTLNLLALGVGFSSELTGLDNIFLNGMLLGFTKKQIEKVKDEIIEYSEIGNFIRRPMKTYSSGMVSRLGFSIAIHLRPEVLLIDEVLSVGDTRFREKSFGSIRQVIAAEDITVVIVSHSMAQLSSLCRQIIWLDKGQVVTKGKTDQVLALYQQYNDGRKTVDEIRALGKEAAQ